MDFDVDDVVWAKMRGYPYWPALITVEASSGLFKKGNGASRKFHVDFLGGEWISKWIKVSEVRKFEAEDTGPNRKKDYRASARWEALHLAAMKLGLDKLLQKGGLTLRMEPNQAKEPSLAQHSSDTHQDMKVDKEDSDRQVPMSKDFSVVSREESQFFTPEQEFTLTSPHQQFFTPSLNGSFLFHASPEVNPKEGQLGIKFSPEQTKLDNHQWSSTPLKTESGFLEPRKYCISSLKQKKTIKSKKKSEDTTWRRKSRRQSMSQWVRDEPDLVSSPQLDAHWLKPFKCRICHTRFGWAVERDSHELICEGEIQGSEEYGVKCEVDDLKVDLSAASEATVNEDFTALGQLATKVDLAFESLVSGKDDSKTGSQSGLKILANESRFNEKLGMVEKLEVEVHQPSDNQTNLQLVHCESPDTVLESEFYVGNYAEVEWRTEEYGLEANNRLEDMEIVEGEGVDTRKDLPDNSARAEESMDMEMNVSNDTGITMVKTGLKRKIDLQDHDEDKYDSMMKRNRHSDLESASLSRKDTNETDDQVVNTSNAEHVNSETRCQDNIYSVEMSDNQGNDQIFLVDNQVYDQHAVSPENCLVIDEEILLVSANSVGSHENNNKISEMISLEKDESRSHENPPNNTQADNLVPFEQSSVYSLVKSDNSKNAPESTPECSHMESRVDGELNDEGFPEEGATFDPPISSAKSYPKMNSLKDEKKMSSKFENCIRSPRVKTKAELKEYGEGTTRTMEKSSQNSDKKNKSPLLSQDKENLLKQTRDRNKSKTQSHAKVKPETQSHAKVKPETQSHAKVKSETQSHAKVKSETQSPAKVKSEIQSHAKVKSEIQSHSKVKSEIQSHAKVKSEIQSHSKVKSETHDQGKSATKTYDQGKSAIKTLDKIKSATKTHDQGKSATKTLDKIKSATETLDKIKSATETHDQGKSASKTQDKAKLATKTLDQGKLASRTNDKIKLNTKTHDKVKPSSKTNDQVKSLSNTHGQDKLETQAHKIKLVTKTQDELKSETKTQDRVKSSTKTHDQGKLASKPLEKVKSSTKTCDKIKSETNMHDKVNLPTKSHDRGKTTAKTHEQVKTRETHDQGKLTTKTYKGKSASKIHDESKLATQTHDVATKTCGKLPKIPKRTHDEGKLLTYNLKQGKLPTTTRGNPKLVSKSHDKRMPSTSPDTGDKSKLLTQTGDKKQLGDRSRVTSPVPSDQSQLSIPVRDKGVDNNNTKDHVQIKRCSEEQFGDKNVALANISHQQKSGQDNIRLQESKKIHSMDTFARDKERHKKQNNVRSNESLKDRTDYRRVEPPFSRHRSNFRQESKKYCKDSSKTISNRDDANLKVKDAFKATYAKHDVNLKERDRDTFKVTSIKPDPNSKRKREDDKRSLKATSDKYDDNVKDKRSEHSGHSRRLLDNKHGRNISKDSDTKISSHSEQLSLRYHKAVLGGKKELKPSKYRFKEKSTDVDKRWSRNSSPPSSPDAEDKHWKRQKGYLTQNDQHKDENPATRNECKLDKDENMNNNDNQGRGSKQFYRHHIRRDKEYPQENLFPRSDEDMPGKLRDCQASEDIDDIKNGNLLILNEQEMGIQCLEMKVEQEKNPEYSKQNEEVRTCDVQENDTNQIENFSYNDSNKVQEFPVWDANDYLEFPNYDVSAATLDKLPSKNIFDSHCHLDILFYKLTDKPRRFNDGYMPNGIQLKSFTEFKKYYEREIHDKFEGCVTNFCDPKQWNVTQPIPDLIRSLDREEGVYYTVGCHPRHADFMMNKKSRDALERIVKWGKGKGGKCVAIGECGLDFNNHNPYKRSTSFSTQRAVFKFQLELAMELGFPLVLHIRDAEEKAYAVMEEVGLPSDHPIHRHCFNDSWSACQTWMKKFPGSFIGLTNLLLKPGVKHLHEVARLIPLERLILETDSPYFSPRVENRVFPLDLSHPGDVVHVAAMVAKLRKDSLQNVLAANRRNIATLYHIREEPRVKPGQWRVDGRKR